MEKRESKRSILFRGSLEEKIQESKKQLGKRHINRKTNNVEYNTLKNQNTEGNNTNNEEEIEFSQKEAIQIMKKNLNLCRVKERTSIITTDHQDTVKCQLKCCLLSSMCIENKSE